MNIVSELVAGGLSCAVASTILNPMDVVKVRLQTQHAVATTPVHIANSYNHIRASHPGQSHTKSTKMYLNFRHALSRIIAEEGLVGLWTPGLAASVVRELTYSSLRLGLYPLIKALIATPDQADIGFARKFAISLTTGAVGSCLCNPTDVVKIRLQAEAGRVANGVYVSGLYAGQEPHYSSTLDCFRKVLRHEGWSGLYRGWQATTARAALLTAGQLSSYDHTKFLLKKHKMVEEGTKLHIIGSLVAGVAATTLAAPADVVKTRIMADKATTGAGGVVFARRYSGVVDCLVKTVREEGILAIFRGWVPSYFRLGPHFIISMPLLEVCRVRLFGLKPL